MTATPKSFRWQQPVDVRFGAGADAAVADALGSRRAVVLAFEAAHATGIARRWQAALDDRVVDWVDIADGLSSTDRIRALAERVWPTLAEVPGCVVVGLGGGTTLDLAKVVRCRALGGEVDRVVAALRGEAAWPELAVAPLWLVPTTAGTGSEVTRWATVWDLDGERPQKRSFDEPFGYAERAFVDPTLTASCPGAVTRDCGLDAFAHALEAIWNRYANPVTDALAARAAARIAEALPALLQEPADGTLRAEMSLGALEAGLAFSQTRTALAHALSYELTLARGVPHGHACALWLPTAWRLAQGCDDRVDALLRGLFRGGGATALEAWLRGMGIDPRPESVGVADAAQRVGRALTSARGANFIASDAAPAESMLEASV